MVTTEKMEIGNSNNGERKKERTMESEKRKGKSARSHSSEMKG